jgi:hypothetical protein
MANDRWRGYLESPREFDKWLNANAVLGLVIAIAILAMALASLYSAGPRGGATELSSANVRSK